MTDYAKRNMLSLLKCLIKVSYITSLIFNCEGSIMLYYLWLTYNIVDSNINEYSIKNTFNYGVDKYYIKRTFIFLIDFGVNKYWGSKLIRILMLIFLTLVGILAL